MWAILLPYLIKFGISVAVSILEKTGCINAAEKFGLKAGTHVIQAVESVQTYDEYPTGKNGASAVQPGSASNINKE